VAVIVDDEGAASSGLAGAVHEGGFRSPAGVDV